MKKKTVISLALILVVTGIWTGVGIKIARSMRPISHSVVNGLGEEPSDSKKKSMTLDISKIRDPFWGNTAKQEKVIVKAGSSATSPSLKLVGIMDGTEVIMVPASTPGKSRILKQGQSWDGTTIMKIDKDSVIIQDQNGNKFRLYSDHWLNEEK